MAHQVLEYKEEESVVKKPVAVVKQVVNTIQAKTPPLVDSLVLLIIAFWYFFFTGLAIVFKRPIPKEWMKIATHLSKGRIVKKVRGVEDQVVKPPKFRIMDLETKRPISLN